MSQPSSDKTTVAPSQHINAICEELPQWASPAQINKARADLRRVAEKVKALEIFHAEMTREAEEEAALAERQRAWLERGRIVKGPWKQRVDGAA